MITKTFYKIYSVYPYFISTLAGILFLGILLDTKPLLSRFYYLIEEDKNTTQQVEEKERAWQQAAPVAGQWLQRPLVKMPKPILDQVSSTARKYLTRIKSLQAEFKTKENKNATAAVPAASSLPYQSLIIKMGLNADFTSVNHFLASLREQALPLRLDALSLKRQGDSLEVFLQFSAFPWIFARGPSLQQEPALVLKEQVVRDPFQEAESLFLESPAWDQASMDQIQYVGYGVQDTKPLAFILLPDSQVYDVDATSLLGKDEWRVLKMDEHALTLIDRRQNQRQYLMKERAAFNNKKDLS